MRRQGGSTTKLLIVRRSLPPSAGGGLRVLGLGVNGTGGSRGRRLLRAPPAALGSGRTLRRVRLAEWTLPRPRRVTDGGTSPDHRSLVVIGIPAGSIHRRARNDGGLGGIFSGIRRRQINPPIAHFGPGITLARGIRQTHFDVALFTRPHALRQVEVQRIALADARQCILQSIGVIHGHTVAARTLRDLRGPGRVRPRPAHRRSASPSVWRPTPPDPPQRPSCLRSGSAPRPATAALRNPARVA